MGAGGGAFGFRSTGAAGGMLSSASRTPFRRGSQRSLTSAQQLSELAGASAGQRLRFRIS